jgi:hypothetical protein
MRPGDEFDPELPAEERDALLRFASDLDGARPVPPPAFRGDLGRAVTADAARRHLRPRPQRLWLWVAASAASGAALLAVAAAQI